MIAGRRSCRLDRDKARLIKETEQSEQSVPPRSNNSRWNNKWSISIITDPILIRLDRRPQCMFVAH